MAAIRRITLENEAFQIILLPERGASLARAAWRHPDGDWREIMERPSEADIDDAAGSLSKLSSFIMLPFANRIDGARFRYDGAVHDLAMNRPEQNCAIHGLSRGSSWRLVESGPTHAVVEDDYVGAGPWRYLARQEVSLVGAVAHIDLSVENRGAQPLPFGFGLHPWFERRPSSTLQFSATTTFTPDERTFPTEAIDAAPPLSFAEPVALESVIGLDQHYAGWEGRAILRQPDFGYGVELRGEGAYGNLHIFSSPDRPSFCVEPVTHVTDVLNRRQFAAYGDMARLEPGETLSARMTLAPFALL